MTSPAVRRASRAAVGAALLLGYPLLLTGAALGTVLAGRCLFAVAAAACYLAEIAAPDVAPRIVSQLNWLQVGAGLRAVIRPCAVLVLLARTTDLDLPQFALLAIGVVALHAIRAVYSALVIYVLQRRQLPAVTRNVDLTELAIPDAPPRVLTTNHSWRLMLLDIPAVAGAVVTAFTGSYGWVAAGFATGLGVGCAGCAVMTRHVLRHRHLYDGARCLAVVQAQVSRYAPEVVLYFAGPRDSVYQLNMWLSVLDRLQQRVLIVMRERWLTELLEPTSLPVVCIDDQVHLADFALPAVRVALYPSNNAKNIHMLRNKEMRHVFIGHGDSDKSASTNPFSRVYDEIWVAELTQARARDATGTRAANSVLTILYAPTWEGWESRGGPMSTIAMGPHIARILTADDRIRLLYRPHPLTGTQKPQAAAAHNEIVRIIERANLDRRDPASGACPPQPPPHSGLAKTAGLPVAAPAGRPQRDPARDGWPDYAGLSRDSATGSRPRPGASDGTRSDACLRQANARHLALTGPAPSLYDAFGHCDVLITDISSVISDFLTTGKPYVVTNPSGSPTAEFRAANPSASAAYLLSPDCTELTEIVTALSRSGEDLRAPDRARLAGYLLGPRGDDAQRAFNAAVDALAPAQEGRTHLPSTPAEQAATRRKRLTAR